MRHILLAFFALAPAFAISQSVTYRIDPVARDSFFLVETTTAAATPESPRPAVAEAHQLFRSVDQANGFVGYLRKQAEEAGAKAAEAEKQAADLRAAQRRLETYSGSIEAAIRAAMPLFSDQAKNDKK